MSRTRAPQAFVLACGAFFWAAACFHLFIAEARGHSTNPRATQRATSLEANNIGGVVTSSNGPEAGVWVIAETTDLPTRFRKVVVTNGRGQYLLPDLPKAN